VPAPVGRWADVKKKEWPLMQPCCLLCPAVQVGISGVETNQGNVTSWPYASSGGKVAFAPQDMLQASMAACACAERHGGASCGWACVGDSAAPVWSTAILQTAGSGGTGGTGCLWTQLASRISLSQQRCYDQPVPTPAPSLWGHECPFCVVTSFPVLLTTCRMLPCGKASRASRSAGQVSTSWQFTHAGQ